MTNVATHAAAREMLRRGRPAEAERALRALLAGNPRQADLLGDLGMALTMQNKIAEAISSFEAALAANPKQPQALEALGRLYGETGRPADALGCLDRLLAAMPFSPSAYMHHILRGLALQRLGRKAEAIAAFEAALSRKPDFPGAWEVLGKINFDSNRPGEALRCFERLRALQPNTAPAHCYCGVALTKLNRFEEAVESYREALRLDAKFLPARIGIGEPLSALGRNEDALAAYESALKDDPRNAQAEIGRGDILQILGRKDEAAAAYRRVIALAPQWPAAHRRLLQVVTVADENDPALKALEALLPDEAKYTDAEAAELHLALAKAYRDLGRPGPSFAQLEKGNRRKRRTVAYDEAVALADLRAPADALAPEIMRSHAGLGDPSELPVFVIGMPRSGTSLVEQILASHSRVFGVGEQSDFFLLAAQRFGQRMENLAAALSGDTLRQLGEAYVAHVSAKAPAAARIVDKMPINFCFAGLIHLALPKARIIHVTRDPMDTCFSCYSQVFWGNVNYAYDLGELGRFYRAYEALMARWRAVLPAETMLDVRYETLVEDIEGEARRLIAFLGLDWEERCQRFHETERAVRTASATQVRRPLYREAIGRWKPYAQWLEPLRAALETSA